METLNPEILINELLTEAMSWVTTPFEHQGKIKGKGVDCVHFVEACLITKIVPMLGLTDIKIPDNYNPKEDGKVILQILGDVRDRGCLDYVLTGDRRRGDLVAFIDSDLRDKDRPSHMAFISDVNRTTYIIEAGRRGVVRHRLDGLWIRRIHSCWRLKWPENLINV